MKGEKYESDTRPTEVTSFCYRADAPIELVKMKSQVSNAGSFWVGPPCIMWSGNIPYPKYPKMIHDWGNQQELLEGMPEDEVLEIKTWLLYHSNYKTRPDLRVEPWPEICILCMYQTSWQIVSCAGLHPYPGFVRDVSWLISACGVCTCRYQQSSSSQIDIWWASEGQASSMKLEDLQQMMNGIWSYNLIQW